MLIEEMSESQKDACKILRHGFESSSPLKYDGVTNRQNLEREIGNVIAGICLMVAAGDLDGAAIKASAQAKFKDYRQWLHHQPDKVLNRLTELF